MSWLGFFMSWLGLFMSWLGFAMSGLGLGAELVYHGAELVYHGAELVYPPPPMPPSKNIKVSPAPPRLEREPRPHARLPPGPRTLMFFLIGGGHGGRHLSSPAMSFELPCYVI